MEINFGESADNEDPIPFFDLDEEIRKLIESTSTHRDKVIEVEVKYQTKHHEISAKILALREQLDSLHTKQYEECKKLKDKYNEDLDRLNALRKQKAEEEANKAYEETARLIKEICEDFAAWNMAREYQIEDVVRIVHQFLIGSTGVMNANEMSLGKTFESIVALYIIRILFEQKYGRPPKMLWLTKASIVETGGTKNEATRWDPSLKMFPLRGSDNKTARETVFKMASLRGGSCILTNYETLRTTPEARKVQWDIVVMDEVHKLKGGANANGATAIWSTVKDVVGTSKFIMMLTGTPLVNKVEEIWSYLHIFDPVVFPDARRFARQFSAFKDMSGKLQFSLQSERLLKDILKGRLIRRTAHEVGLQMPPVTYIDTVLPHNLQQGEIYQQMREKFFIWLDGQEKPMSATSILAQLTRLRQINVLPVANFTIKDEYGNITETIKLDCRDSSKLDEAVDIISQTQDQVIVFCSFNEPLNELAFRLQVEGISSAVISSETTKSMSAYEIGFQNKDIDVLLINSAMGEGMNLHKDIAKWPGGARAVIMLDRWWNPARNRQCIARAVRPETDQSVKEREPVMVYNLYCDQSIDYFIQALIDEKAAQFDAITEAKELRHPTEWKEMLRKLL